MPKTTRWKGRFITEKQYNRKEKQSIIGKSNTKINVAEENNDTKEDRVVKGLRIVDFNVLASHMYYTFCKSLLSLSNIEDEMRKGLDSIFKVRCRDCLIMNEVPTGYMHNSTTGEMLFDINSKLALGE